VGAIDASALVPFVKKAHQAAETYFLYCPVLNAEKKIVLLCMNGNGAQKSVQKKCNQWCPQLTIHEHQIRLVMKIVSK